MKRIVILFFLCISPFVTVSNALEPEMYGNISLMSIWKSPTRFDYDSVGLVWDTINWEITDTAYAADSMGTLILNEWLPAGQLGIKFKMGQFGACIEFGVGKNAFDAKLTGSITTRYLYQKYGFFITANKWYAEWLINDYFSLLVGQDYTPANFFSNNRILGPQIRYGNIGCFYVGPKPMFQLAVSAKDNIVQAKVAVVKVDTVTIPLRGAEDAPYTNEVKIPKFEGSVQFDKDFSELFGIGAKVAGGYQNYTTFRYPDLTSDAIRDSLHADVISYLFAGELSLRLWRITMTYSMFHGQNLGPYGMTIGEPSAWWRTNDYHYAKMYYPKHVVDSSAKYFWTLYDSKVTEMSWVVKMKLTDFLFFEGGYQDIFGDHEYDEFIIKWENDYNYAWYGQCMLTLFEYLKLTLPEIGFTKFGRYKGYGKYFYVATRLGIEF